MYKVVSENFSIFLNSISDYSLFLNEINEQSEYLISKITKGYFIGKDLRDDLVNYPKFPYEFAPIGNINRFDISKIYNVTQNQRAEGLRTFVPENLNLLKVRLDKLPSLREDFYSQLYFQKIYFENIPTDIFGKQNFLARIYNVDRNDYFYKMVKTNKIEEISNLEFFQQIVHSMFLSKQIQRVSDFFEQFSHYYYISDFINYNKIMNSFENYFDKSDVLDTFVNNLTELISKSIYSFIEHTDLIKDHIGDVIKSSIAELNTKFGQIIETRIKNIEKNILFYLQYLLNNYLVVQSLNDLCQNRDNIFSDPYNYFGAWGPINIKNVNNEEDFVRYFLNRVTPNNIKDYFYLWFSYNSYPLKFINSLSFITKKMVDDFVFTHLDMVYLNKEYVKGALNGYEKNVDFDQYAEIINNNVSPENIQEIINNEKIIETAIFLSLMGELDNFFNSEAFDNYVYNLMRDIFRRLRNEGFVEYSFDWYKENLSIFLFFKSYLKNGFTNGELFDDIIYDLRDFFANFMSEDFLVQEGELLSEDASIKTRFFTKFQFDEDSVVLYLDGEIVSDENYELKGGQRTILFNQVPQGDVLTIDYVIYYPIEYGTTGSELDNHFRRFAGSDTNAELIKNLMNNVYYTTIIKQLHLNILSDYLIK